MFYKDIMKNDRILYFLISKDLYFTCETDPIFH